MLPVLLIALAAQPSCESRCGARATRCFTTCGGATKCANRCDRTQNDCLATCGSKEDDDVASARTKKPMPCGVDHERRAIRPCNADEQKLLASALDSKQAKALCRDADGALTACPEDLAKAQKLFDSLKSTDECIADGGVGAQCTKD